MDQIMRYNVKLLNKVSYVEEKTFFNFHLIYLIYVIFIYYRFC